MNCRHCDQQLEHIFLDLGFAPPSNAYLTDPSLKEPESSFPLKLFVCDQCWLVQTEDYAEASDLFCPDYAYFSSVSQSWLSHASSYVEQIRERLSLNAQSFVIEVASNDGYLRILFLRVFLVLASSLQQALPQQPKHLAYPFFASFSTLVSQTR